MIHLINYPLIQGKFYHTPALATITAPDDIKNLKDWNADLNFPLRFRFQPIRIFQNQIDQMLSTFTEFPEDEERTNKIIQTLNQPNARPFPVFTEFDDKSNFILEGRHRIVAFHKLGLSLIPTLHVKMKTK